MVLLLSFLSVLEVSAANTLTTGLVSNEQQPDGKQQKEIKNRCQYDIKCTHTALLFTVPRPSAGPRSKHYSSVFSSSKVKRLLPSKQCVHT